MSYRIVHTNYNEILESIHSPYLERGNSDKDTALHYAAKCTGNVEMAHLLSDLVDILNLEGVSPLLAAVQHKRIEMVEYLAGRSDMGVRTKDGDTVLHYATSGDVARLLVGADVNAENKLGLTPMMQAASNNRPEVVRYLLEQGADPAVQDSRGRTALDFAKVYPPREECIKLL